jgi:release factor glutamine methyltransferase
VLVPRPETELLVEWALEISRDLRPHQIADLGTGSGAIALALAHEQPDTKVIAIDSSATAPAVARANAAALRLANVAFLQESFASFAEDRVVLGGMFDLIVSNPPYVAEGDPHLRDLAHEPSLALTAGADGLACLRAIVAGSPRRLRENGWLLVEHGFGHGAAVRALFEAAGFRNVETRRDLGGRERATGGQRP